MISLEKLYDATDDGLQIIALHYPDAPQAARDNKPFKADRANGRRVHGYGFTPTKAAKCGR